MFDTCGRDNECVCGTKQTCTSDSSKLFWFADCCCRSGGTDKAIEIDVGADIGIDVGFDIGIDVGSDIGIDVGSDIGIGVGSDIGIDAH